MYLWSSGNEQERGSNDVLKNIWKKFLFIIFFFVFVNASLFYIGLMS